MSLQWHVGVCHSKVLGASTNKCRTAEGVCHGYVAEEVEGHVVALIQDVPAAVQCDLSERQDVKYVVHVTVAVALSARGRQSLCTEGGGKQQDLCQKMAHLRVPLPVVV